MALYKEVHPEYASYLYLMAPISLAILNPIGLVLMEISKIIKNKEEVTRNPPSVRKLVPLSNWANNVAAWASTQFLFGIPLSRCSLIHCCWWLSLASLVASCFPRVSPRWSPVCCASLDRVSRPQLSFCWAWRLSAAARDRIAKQWAWDCCCPVFSYWSRCEYY